ncbi:Wzz/FepE/Etk N-terminal domain-containing protein [Specibacter sp. NPDC057265]|uniref:Wzz/FepE/Etk N-terminal domain-containing protein n=1 Tax=Specibacter sp. NPDC057265 TaxID=3346075 RepID=UPI003644810D
MQQKNISAVKVGDLMMTFARRWPVILVTTLICAALGFALGATAPKIYTATATLTVSPITTSPFSSAAVNQQINITTERAILSSGEVAAIAAQELGEKASSGSLQSNTETAAPSGSQILEVSVTLPDAEKAARQANALAKAYLQFRSEGAAEVAAGYIAQIDERLKNLSNQATLTDSQQQQVQNLQQQRTELTLASANPGRLIGSATAPAQQSSMGLLVFMAAGTMGGVLLGLALALVRERTDPKVRTAARLGALFENELVLVNDKDQEPVRWLVRTVRLGGARDAGHGTIFVGVITLPGSGPAGLHSWLASLARRHKLDVLAVSAQRVSPTAVDLGWPARAGHGRWENSDMVFVEVGSGIAGTRLADLADRMDLLIVSAGKRTPLRALRQTLALVRTLPAERIIPVLYAPSGRRRSHRQHKWTATSADQPPAQQGAAAVPVPAGRDHNAAAPSEAGHVPAAIPPFLAHGIPTSIVTRTATAVPTIQLNPRER